jgi:hypothetical protein
MPALQNWPYQNTFWTGTQDLRIIYNDPCGNLNIMSLGSITYSRQLVDANSWELTQ